MFKFDDVEIFWINCSSNLKRFEHMKSLLEKYFPNNKQHHVEAVMHSPKYQGVTMAHTVALLKGISTKRPFIILEDDVTIDAELLDTKRFENEINKLEEKPRVVYMGLSTWGTRQKRHKEIFKGKTEYVLEWNDKIFFNMGAKGENIKNDYFIKVDDMYGAHSILYLSREYAIKTLKYCIMAVELNKPHDIYLPKLMRKNIVIGMREPCFYQLAKIGGQERATKLNLKNIKKIEIV